ncbi:MAG: ATP-binding cassette domain-containing protein [Lachnospiraceae bacterium]|nr:ATP-binding cassette domain-containing protein [Lachnospiraceae bacterium]
MLDIQHISKTFYPGTVNEKKAITDLSLHVEKGDFISIIGANGAGKSTLFNCIAGVFLTDSGTIMLDGEDITMVPEYIRSRKIGRIFQNPVLGTAPDMSIGENLALACGKGGWLSTVSKKEKLAFREKLASLDMCLEDRMDHPVGLLSGGQRQVIALIMSTYNPPSLLMLDEHTAALDPATSEKVLTLTQDIVAENQLTCLMITHNMQSALSLGNRTLMMDQGNIIYDVKGPEREKTTVSDLMTLFKERSGKALDNDRMLLEK